ncbi:hypothetical protein MNBD_ALPHA04-1659 [hydrothermal vent metagenome]|uniref:Ice-binding protein C-terminal domain-containing protein n=1 Tax=hydrothermal vent metagenome TaxID=652676 RepID=A0A3B0RAU3_9ZZZZ
MKKLLLATVAAVALPASANAATLIVDVTGSESLFAFGTAGNEVETYNIGAGSRVTGVSFDVNISAFAPSWLSEARLAYTDSGVTTGVFFTPGIGDNFSGTSNYSGITDLVGLGLDFVVGADGILRLEYFEGFVDDAASPDAIWDSGTITFTYTLGAIPEPTTWAMLIFGFGAIGGALRNRNRRRTRKTNVRVSYA